MNKIFDPAYIIHSIPIVAEALPLTLLIMILSLIFGLILGLVITAIKFKKKYSC